MLSQLSQRVALTTRPFLNNLPSTNTAITALCSHPWFSPHSHYGTTSKSSKPKPKYKIPEKLRRPMWIKPAPKPPSKSPQTTTPPNPPTPANKTTQNFEDEFTIEETTPTTTTTTTNAKKKLRTGPTVFFPNEVFRLRPVTPGETVKKVVFVVPKNLSKPEIKDYLEKIYGIGVEAVNVYVAQGKEKRRPYRNIKFREPSIKKAIITLTEPWTAPLPRPPLAKQQLQQQAEPEK